MTISNIKGSLSCQAVDNKTILEKELYKEMTIKQLFKSYEGESVNVTPFIFESTGNEKW